MNNVINNSEQPQTDRSNNGAKANKRYRNNSKKPQTDRSNNGAKVNKDSVIIVSDSMIKHVNGRDISRSQTVKVHPNPAASTHDLLDYVKPAMRKKPKAW